MLEELPGKEAREVETLLSFDENSAGGMMTTDFVYVGETATRAEVVDWIRGRDIKLEQLDTIFLIDGDAKLSGAVAVARLLLTEADDGAGPSEVGAAGFRRTRRERERSFRHVRQVQPAQPGRCGLDTGAPSARSPWTM